MPPNKAPCRETDWFPQRLGVAKVPALPSMLYSMEKQAAPIKYCSAMHTVTAKHVRQKRRQICFFFFLECLHPHFKIICLLNWGKINFGYKDHIYYTIQLRRIFSLLKIKISWNLSRITRNTELMKIWICYNLGIWLLNPTELEQVHNGG